MLFFSNSLRSMFVVTAGYVSTIYKVSIHAVSSLSDNRVFLQQVIQLASQ
jgi:hypothetical protein